MNPKALKEFFIAFVSIIILIILFLPIISKINLNNMNLEANLKDGKVLPSSVEYRESPFVFDIIGSKAGSSVIYDSTGIDIAGSADISYRMILDKDSRIIVRAKLKPGKNRPRVWLYSSDGKLISSGKVSQKNDLTIWEFDINDLDLYKLRAQFNYEDVLSINSDLLVNTKKTRKQIFAEYFDKNLKVMEFKLDFSQMNLYKDLKRAQEKTWEVPLAKGSRWKQCPSIDGRVIARIRSQGNDHWSLVSLGLAGRNEAHSVANSILSSLDIKIISGELVYGLRKFKLYSLKSKNFLRDFIFEHDLRDMGLFFPRQDIVKVIINGQDYGYMELLEGVDSPLFEYAQRQEGAIVGYDVDEILAVANHSHLKKKSYFKKKKYPAPDMFEPSFADNLCDDQVLTALSFNLGIAGFHGMGQSDLRFHLNKRKNCHELMIRDTNSGLPIISSNAPFIFSEAMVNLAQFVSNWRPLTVSFSSNHVIKHEDKILDIDRHFYWWHATPVILNYLSNPEKFARTLEYTKLWDSPWMRKKLMTRFLNTFEVINANSKGLTQLDLQSIRKSLEFGVNIIAQFPKRYVSTCVTTDYSLKLKKYIELVSKEEVVISDFVLKTLNWRNQQVEGLVKKRQEQNTLKMGESIDYPNLIKFLYREEKEEYSYLFFIVRNFKGKDNFKFTLLNLDNEEYVNPYNTIEFGKEPLKASKFDIVLNKIDVNEKVKLLAFKIPRSTQYIYLQPIVSGDATYWGVKEYFIYPIFKQIVEKKLTDTGLASKDFSTFQKIIRPRFKSIDIKKSILIPKSYTLEISGDQEFKFAKDACIQVLGEVRVLDNARLRLEAIEDSWQGAHFHGVSALQNIEISDLGTGDYGVHCFGRDYSGGFSIFDSNLKFKNIKVNESHVEDSIHFLRSEVEMENVRVEHAQSDSIDADFCVVKANNLNLSKAGSDGLDLSGSFASVKNSDFSDNTDKGISVGENSQLFIKDNKFKNDHFGIAVKDSSSIESGHNYFGHNDYGIVRYAKKEYFSIPDMNERELILENEFEENRTNIENLKFNPK